MRTSALLILFFLCSLPAASWAADADISDTQRLLYVADSKESFIDIVNPSRGESIHRLVTPSMPNHLLVTPFAPLLVYANEKERQLHTYNLETGTWLSVINLPIVPMHIVLDTSGSKIGISDSIDGGFVLVNAYNQQILLQLPDLPPTSDILFDPNGIDIFYTSDSTGALGVIDINLGRYQEISLNNTGSAVLSSPSRSLDGRYIYVADQEAGEVYSLNAYSKVIYKTFSNGDTPARPYTTPQGLFLYVMDSESGALTIYDQNRFAEYTDLALEGGINLVTVGRQDRLNLFMSSRHSNYLLFDNAGREIVESGQFNGTPLQAYGSVDGETAFIAFSDSSHLARVNLESGVTDYINATNNGAGAFAIGLSNNVCH